MRNLILGGLMPLIALGAVMVRAQTPAPPLSPQQRTRLAEATRFNALQIELKKQGKFPEALAAEQQALAICREVLGDHLDTATSANNLGNMNYFAGDYAAARPYYEEVLRIRTKLLGAEHPLTATSNNTLGLTLFVLHEFPTARPYYEEALRARVKLFGEEHEETANVLNNLGRLMDELGDFSAARAYLERALQIRRKVLGQDHDDTASSYNSLAFVLEAQADYGPARGHFLEALRIWRKIGGDEYEDTTTALNNLGLLLHIQGDLKAARPYYEEALKIRRKVLGENHPQTANSLNNLGGLLEAQGERKTARDFYEQALKIEQASLGAEHPQTAQTLNNLGMLLVREREVNAARPYLDEALRVKRKIFGEAHPETMNGFRNLMSLEAVGGNPKAAAEWMDLERRASRRHVARVLPGLSDKEQLTYLATNEEFRLHTAFSLALPRPNDQEIVTRAAGWLVNSKGVAQAALASRSLLARDATDPNLFQTVQELTAVRHNLAGLAMLAVRPEQQQTRQATLDQLIAEEQRLSRQLPANTATADANWLEIETLRQAIPQDSIFVDFVRFRFFDYQSEDLNDAWRPAHYAAWIIPPAGRGEVRMIDLGHAELVEQAIEQARQSLADAGKEDSLRRREGEVAAEAAARKDLTRVSELIWKPLAEQLGAAKKLILSPDGALWLVPWAALPISNGQYVVEQFSLKYVISGRDLIPPAAALKPTMPPYVFADPDFDLAPEGTQAAVKIVLPDLKRYDVMRSLATAKTLLPRVQRLPNTALEARAVSPNIKTLTSAEPSPYLGAYALEGVVKRVARPRMLLFATHGFFLPDQEAKPDDRQLGGGALRSTTPISSEGKPIENPLLRCGLLFAGCNTPQATVDDDGILTGLEIVGLDLRGTELVVLSACETGIGKLHNGEGVAGLRQAFQLAGAQSVVSTLWQVPDADSALVMNEFFVHLVTGQSRAEALRNAQLARIAARREKFEAAHPYFWAAWTVTGY